MAVQGQTGTRSFTRRSSASTRMGKSVTKPNLNFSTARPSGGGTMTFPPVGAHSPTGPGSMDQVLRSLLNHATQGFNLPDYWEAKGMGYDAWLEWQLDYEAIDDSAVDSALAYYPTLTMNNPTLYTTYVNDAATVVYELQDANLRRSIYSRKQLYERMVEFWTDHFSISQLDDYCLWFKTRDEARVIRKHALGSFPEMLRNSPKSAAMLWYLDNWNNQAGAVQENYARELLELHTLGVDGPYTQQDVVEVARCFTGWTFTGLYDSQPIGLFSFKGNYHDYGQKTVLGNVINGSGVSEGEQVIDILATHPKTAEFISTKMARWLLGYEPPQDLIDRLVQIYLSTQGSIKPMVREILSMEVLGKVKPEVRTKFKRPYHVITSIMRAARVPSSNLLALTIELQRLGHGREVGPQPAPALAVPFPPVWRLCGWRDHRQHRRHHRTGGPNGHGSAGQQLRPADRLGADRWGLGSCPRGGGPGLQGRPSQQAQRRSSGVLRAPRFQPQLPALLLRRNPE